MRRQAIRRFSSGIPIDSDRCASMVERSGELFRDRCKRPRKRGYIYCSQHWMDSHHADQPG